MTLPAAAQQLPRLRPDGSQVSTTSSAISLRRRGSGRHEPDAGVDVDRLVVAWRAGDDTARDLVLGEVRRRTLRYLAGLRVPAHECEDLAQEVCLGVLAAAPGWDGKGASLWALVFTIARNKHVDRARRSARAPVLGRVDSVENALGGRPDDVAGPEEQVLLSEASQQIAALLEQLPPNQRDVLLLRIVVGLTVAETAAALGLKHGSVHVLQHRALTTLRGRLAGGRS